MTRGRHTRHALNRRLAPISSAVLAAVVAGCQAVGVEDGPTVLRGAVYTDMRVGMPCNEQTAPRELSGIGLRFVDATGAVVGTALTGPVQARELSGRPGAGGDDDAGCRFSAPYAVTVPTIPSYTVEFEVPDPPERGGYFSGTEELKTQTISRDELADRQFDWSFEVPPSYVVP